MSLAEYQRKRDFKRTPEPKGKDPKATAARRYVVHRHHATRLHWDVRLEMRGVLVSFAVTQGPPLEPPLPALILTFPPPAEPLELPADKFKLPAVLFPESPAELNLQHWRDPRGCSDGRTGYLMRLPRWLKCAA